MTTPQITLILDNIRSGHNVGSIFRTSDAVGVREILLCGITPYPALPNDTRPQHVINANTKQIHKTALGAEQTIKYTHFETCQEAVRSLKAQGQAIYGLENNTHGALDIVNFQPARSFTLVLGNEVDGIDKRILKLCDEVLEIPMQGNKNSLNVSVAAGVALYTLLSRVASS